MKGEARAILSGCDRLLFAVLHGTAFAMLRPFGVRHKESVGSG